MFPSLISGLLLTQDRSVWPCSPARVSVRQHSTKLTGSSHPVHNLHESGSQPLFVGQEKVIYEFHGT